MMSENRMLPGGSFVKMAYFAIAFSLVIRYSMAAPECARSLTI